MQLNLVPHPETPPSEPFKLWVNVDHSGAFGATATTNMWYCIGAPASRFVVPASEEPARADKLWETTCFEAFLRKRGELPYREWNFAPSGDWAAYDFTATRDGKSDPEVSPPPYVRIEDNMTWWAVGATISLPSKAAWDLGLSAVLEERDGTKSYWALAHPSADKPDFHDPACFAAHLP